MFLFQCQRQCQPKVPLSTRRALRRQSDTWPLRGDLGTWTLEGHSKGTRALKELKVL